jgi:hypothetical protein
VDEAVVTVIDPVEVEPNGYVTREQVA